MQEKKNTGKKKKKESQQGRGRKKRYSVLQKRITQISTVSEKETIAKKKLQNPESEDKKNLTLTTTRGRETRDEQGAVTRERKKEIGEEERRKKRDTVVAHAW
jgi:hypothetical protein